MKVGLLDDVFSIVDLEKMYDFYLKYKFIKLIFNLKIKIIEWQVKKTK